MSGSLSLTGYNITEQSWLFLFNGGSGIHLRLARQQWTGADIDWNRNTFLRRNSNLAILRNIRYPNVLLTLYLFLNYVTSCNLNCTHIRIT